MNGKDISVLDEMAIMVGTAPIVYAIVEALFGRFGLIVFIGAMSFVGVLSLIFCRNSNK